MTINDNLEYWVCIMDMFIFAIIGLFISYITTKSITLRRVITGVPIILVEKGKIVEKGVKKLDLMLMICYKNVEIKNNFYV